MTDGTSGEERLENAAPQEASATAATDHGEGWEAGVVEIMGHRQHAGFVREEERFGGKMMRIDVPTSGDPVKPEWKTFWYGAASIFSFALTDADSVYRANRANRERFAPARLSYSGDSSGHDDYDAGDDE